MFIKITFVFLSILKIIAIVNCQFEQVNVIYYNLREKLVNESYIPKKYISISNVRNRLVIDLRSRMFIDKIEISNHDLRKTNVTGKCVENITLFDLYCPRQTPEDHYKCDKVCRTLAVEGIFGAFSMELRGYNPFLDKTLGCYSIAIELNSTEGIDNATYIDDCQSHCKNFHYFAIGELKCICLNSFDKLTWKPNLLCNRPCIRNVLAQCGTNLFYSVYYAGSRNVWQMGIPSLECMHSFTNCPSCIPGRSGYECELINCEIPKSCGERMDCEYTDRTPLYKNAYCKCKIEYNTFFSDGVACKENEYCVSASCESITSRCRYNGTESYVCECKEGYEYRSDTSCKDIDECTVSNTACDKRTGDCVNEIGTYHCVCKPGFSHADKFTCEDIDECASVYPYCSKETSICKNTYSTYVCLCRMGFIGKTLTECIDIDECETLEHNCFNDSVCVNTFGSFMCQCPNHTVKYVYVYGVECEDIDECKYLDVCNTSTSICVNVFGGFTCSCLPGFAIVDDFKCEVDGNNIKSTEDQFVITTETGAIDWYFYQMLVIIGVAIIIASFCTGLIICASIKMLKSEKGSTRKESLASRMMAIKMSKFIKSESD